LLSNAGAGRYGTVGARNHVNFAVFL